MQKTTARCDFQDHCGDSKRKRNAIGELFEWTPVFHSLIVYDSIIDLTCGLVDGTHHFGIYHASCITRDAGRGKCSIRPLSQCFYECNWWTVVFLSAMDKSTYGASIPPNQIYRPDVDISKVDERKLMRRVDIHVIPWLTFVYLLSFLDRGSIANAKVRKSYALLSPPLTLNSFIISSKISRLMITNI